MGNRDSDEANWRAMQARKGTPFLGAKEAAFYLHINVFTLHRMRARGLGPKYRCHGHKVLYHIDDLDAWSAARRR